MLDQRRQFLVLYRAFLFRIMDLEVLTSQGNLPKLIGQFVAILCAFSFVLAGQSGPLYFDGPLSRRQVLVASWGMEEFLIATTIAVVGVFAVISWNGAFPDLRDVLVLGPLPIRGGIIFAARIGAIATGLGLSVLAVNTFTGIAFAFGLAAPGGNPLRSFAAYWITMTAAGLFVFSVLLAAQGFAALLLSYRMSLRVSSFMQLAAFFIILTFFFLTPPLATVQGLTDPANQRLLGLLPSFWFLGLFQQLNGSLHPVFAGLAFQAWRNLLMAVMLAVGTYALAYRRNMRRIVEQPEIAPADRSGRSSRFIHAFVGKCFPSPLSRAIFLFCARTIARSRQHRLLLAIYGGVGFAIALAYIKSLLFGLWKQRWYELNQPLLTGGLVMLFFGVLGMRLVFTMPVALRANWIFRTTQVHSPAMYFSAVRKSLYILAAVPIWMLCAIYYFSIWTGRPALEHMLVLLAVGTLIVERSLYQFDKIPFTCSYQPGKANLTVTLGLSLIILVTLAELGTQVEFWVLQRLARFVFGFAILCTAAYLARRRTFEYAALPYARIKFDDPPASELFALDLRNDSPTTQEAYVDTFERPPFFSRIKRLSLGLLVFMACGLLYERFGEWSDQRRFPRIGQSFDIGQRSLNLFCSGEGSPAAIFVSNWGNPGYSWVAIQREVAKFTRACWYDRAGYGWSDPGPFPYHSDAIAHDLHKLLKAAHVSAPYLLVSDGLSTFHARVFNSEYRTEVAGMVLIDPWHEDVTIHIHNHDERLRPAVIQLVRWAGMFGLFRLIAADPGPPPRGITHSEWATIAALRSQAKFNVAQPKEPPLWVNGEMARSAGGLEHLPLMVVSAKQDDEALARRSSLGVHVMVHAGRQIPYQAPESVIEAVHELLVTIRGRHASSQPDSLQP